MSARLRERRSERTSESVRTVRGIVDNGVTEDPLGTLVLAIQGWRECEALFEASTSWEI